MRCNRDNKINIRGRDLINLCKSANLRICNGRTVGDLFGDFAVIKMRGKSAVDYTIVSKEFLKNILHLQIGDPSHLSDHNYRETTIKCKIVEKIEGQEVSAMKKAYDRFIWQAESPVLHREALKELDFQVSIRNFVETQYDNDNVNITVNDFISILANAGIEVMKLKQDRCNPSPNHAVKYEWFDDECYKLRRILRLKGRKLKRADIIQDESESFYNTCNKYKKMLKDKKQRLLKEMSTLKSSNPKLY